MSSRIYHEEDSVVYTALVHGIPMHLLDLALYPITCFYAQYLESSVYRRAFEVVRKLWTTLSNSLCRQAGRGKNYR